LKRLSDIEDHTVSFSLEVNVEPAYENIRRLETILYRYLGLLRRLGLPPEQEKLIREIQITITLLNQLRLTMIAVQAASGPIGWALAGIGAATFLIDTVEFGLDL